MNPLLQRWKVSNIGVIETEEGTRIAWPWRGNSDVGWSITVAEHIARLHNESLAKNAKEETE
jgi:hypothetical protein